jgi:hypothetical protein
MARAIAATVAALVGAAGCKRGGEPPAAGSGSAPPRVMPADAARTRAPADAAPAGDVPVTLTMSSADAAVLDAVFAAVVSRSDGRCPADAPRSADNARTSAAARIGADTVVALACGSPGADAPAWTLGIARYDGLTARALAVTHLEASDVQVDYFLRASATEVCVDHATIAGTTTIKGLVLCAPLATHQPVVVTTPEPAVPAEALPKRTRTEDEQPAASAALVADVRTCADAAKPVAASYTAALDGETLTIAASCGDAVARRTAIGIHQQREGMPGRLLGSVVHEAEDLVPTAIRADDFMVCADYTTKPDGTARVFCVRRKPSGS